MNLFKRDIFEFKKGKYYDIKYTYKNIFFFHYKGCNYVSMKYDHSEVFYTKEETKNIIRRKKFEKLNRKLNRNIIQKIFNL